MKKWFALLLAALLCGMAALAEPAEFRSDAALHHVGKCYYYLNDLGEARIDKLYDTPDALPIPDTLDGHPVVSLGSLCFSYQTRAASVTFPETLREIGPYAFIGCLHLEALRLPSSLTFIGQGAFRDCGALKTVEFPDSLETLGPGAFHGCGALETVVLPEGLKTIGDVAFEFCTGLTEITLPASVESIGAHAFFGCDALKAVHVTAGSYAEQYCRDNGLPAAANLG